MIDNTVAMHGEFLKATVVPGGSRVLAHMGRATVRQRPWLSFVLFGLGGVVLSASLYADSNEVVSRRRVDQGVILGVLAVLLSIALYWLV